MRSHLLLAIGLLLGLIADVAAQSPLSSNGTLRAAYLADNPSQTVKDPASGNIRGPAVDLARELARRHKLDVTFSGLASPQHVMDAVRNGQADIGFVAYNPERVGPVEFSQPYLLSLQTVLVRQDSPIRSVKDLDRPGNRIAGERADSIALYLARTLKQAKFVEVPKGGYREAMQSVVDGKLEAFGANRQRLTDALRSVSGLRLLPDDLFGVGQTVIVPKGKREGLNAVNQLINDLRRSGALQKSIEQSGVIGIAVAPAAAK